MSNWGLNALQRITLDAEYCKEFRKLLQEYAYGHARASNQELFEESCHVLRAYAGRLAVIEAEQDREKEEHQ